MKAKRCAKISASRVQRFNHFANFEDRDLTTARPRRSALYLPASNPRAIAKARTLACDVIVLDLEDAVAPDAKVMARHEAVAAVRAGDFGQRELVIRVNGLDTEWGDDDIRAVAGAKPGAILVPKIDDAAAIGRYVDAIATSSGGKAIPLWAMIETPLSIFRLEEIAATARTGPLAALVMGTNDLAKEMGAQPDLLRTPFIGMLGLAVAAARAHRLVILDGVFNDIEDTEGLKAQLHQAIAFGFDGKTLIHPGQIAACNAAFMPDADAVAWAERVIAAFDQPENSAKGAIRVDGRMVERLHLHQARRTLAAAA